MTKRFLCIWLPNWPIQRAQAAEPQLASQPVVLTARDPRRGLLVMAANLEARSHGIRPPMRLSEAQALVELEIREHDSQDDIEMLCCLAEQAQRFSPVVGLEQLEKSTWAGRTLHQPECLMLDVSGIGTLFGGEVPLMEEVGYWLHAQQYFGCLGIADTLGAAWAAANYATRRGATPIVPASLDLRPSLEGEQEAGACQASSPTQDRSAASELAYQVPNCCYVAIPPAAQEQALDGLPVTALRLPTATVHSLTRLGIRTIGQLQTLPRAGMATRLGDLLVYRWDQALGLQAEALITHSCLPDWSFEQELEYPTQDRATIIELVRSLTQQLSGRLGQREEGALRIVCRLDLSEAPSLVLQLGLYRPTNDAEHLKRLLVGQLEQHLRQIATAPVCRLHLQATLTAPMVWRQADLFDGAEASKRNELAHLVDTLSARLGRKQVLTATTRRDSQPELAYSLNPLTGRRNNGQAQDTVKRLSTRLARRRAEPVADDPLRRPTHLLTAPVSIEVRLPAAQPGATPVALAPRSIKYCGTWQVVHQAWGPERLESGWWRGPSVRRDYYRVEMQAGDWWWIYRDLQSGNWMLHGQFD